MLPENIDPVLLEKYGFNRRVLIHCSKGIHRTGIMAYSLLRMDGKDRGQAL